MEINFYLPVRGKHRRRKTGNLRWIFSCFGYESARRALDDRKDPDRQRYVVIARDGTVLQDSRVGGADLFDEQEELVGSLQNIF